MKFNFMTGENVELILGVFDPSLSGIRRSESEAAIDEMLNAMATDNLEIMIATRDRIYGNAELRSTNRLSFWDTMKALRSQIAGKEISIKEQEAARAAAEAKIEEEKRQTQNLVKQILPTTKKPTVAKKTASGFNPLFVVVPAVGFIAYKFFKG